MLDDADVLRFIKDKRKQHEAENTRAREERRAKTQRPANYMRSLKKHEEYLEHTERPFMNNARYDNDATYLVDLLQKLEPHAKLTKTELLMVANHRPHKRELLLPMIEDIDSRFSEEQQQAIVSVVVDVLGEPSASVENGGQVAEADGDAMAGG